MPDAPPAVDVVVLTWNDGELLRTAVDSALASEGVEVRVLVIDNASDEPPVLAPDPRVTLVRNDANRGVAPARNQGARLGDNPWLVFLDSDAAVPPTALATLLRPLQEDPSVGVAVPVFADQAPTASAGRAPTVVDKVARGLNLRSTYRRRSRPTGEWWDVDFGIGACQMIRRSVFDEVGGLDDTIFYGPEDVDFCLRVKAAGHRVVQVAGAPVLHPPRRRFRGIFTRRGAEHAVAVVRHLWRHRRQK